MIPPFELHRPESLEDAFAIRRHCDGDAVWLGGGTELLQVMKLGYVAAEHLIDLKRLPELRTVEAGENGGLRIGALTSYRTILADELVRERSPDLVGLISRIGNVRVRSTGTLGGNLCFAEPRSDPVSLLIAVGASVELVSGDGHRSLPVEDFVLGPYQTSLEDGEVLTAIDIPTEVPSGYVKFQVLERPSVGVAVAGPTDNGSFAGAPRVVVGAAVTTPTVCSQAGELLADRPLEAGDQMVRRAGEAAADEIEPVAEPFASVDYKRHLVRALLPRAVEAIAARAPQ